MKYFKKLSEELTEQFSETTQEELEELMCKIQIKNLRLEHKAK